MNSDAMKEVENTGVGSMFNETDPYVILSDKKIYEKLFNSKFETVSERNQLMDVVSSAISEAEETISRCKEELKDNVQLEKNSVITSYPILKRLIFWEGVKSGYNMVMVTLKKMNR